MKEIKKLTKIVFVQIIVLTVLFQSILYAAFVSDNDGPGFVTKAEFEALKEDFNTQINDYNLSIDYKVDGAIAQYLAGISVAKSEILEICNSKILYPMTLRMLGPYNGENVRNITTLSDPTALWTDGYEIFFYGTRQHVHHWAKSNAVKAPNNIIKNFYNGSVVSGKFYIDSIYKDYTIKAIMNTSDHQIGVVGGNQYWENYGMSIFFDQSSCKDAGQSTNNTWDRKDLIYATNARKFTFPQDDYPYVVDVWINYGNSTNTKVPILSSTAGLDKKWNKIEKTADGGYREPTQRHSSWSQLRAYTDSKIDEIFCGSLSSSKGTDKYVPVLYDGKIKLTNINEAKINLISSRIGTHSLLGDQGKKDQQTVYIDNVIDPGLVIEPESNITTTFENASLISGDKCYYIEKWPSSEQEQVFQLTAGIPLCDLPKDAVQLSILFTPSWDETISSGKKYIMFSKEPIVETTDRPDLSTNKDKYLDIKSTKQGVVSKRIELNNNTKNTIYIDDLFKNDKIYYKIVWETGESTNDINYKKTVTITEPQCTAMMY